MANKIRIVGIPTDGHVLTGKDIHIEVCDEFGRKMVIDSCTHFAIYADATGQVKLQMEFAADFVAMDLPVEQLEAKFRRPFMRVPVVEKPDHVPVVYEVTNADRHIAWAPAWYFTLEADAQELAAAWNAGRPWRGDSPGDKTCHGYGNRPIKFWMVYEKTVPAKVETNCVINADGNRPWCRTHGKRVSPGATACELSGIEPKPAPSGADF